MPSKKRKYESESESSESFSESESSSTSESSFEDDYEEDDYYDEEEEEEADYEEAAFFTAFPEIRQARDALLNSALRDNELRTRREITIKKEKIPQIPKKKVDLDCRIETLDDLINLSETITQKPDEEYSVDVDKIKALCVPLKQLRDMVGLKEIKQSIIEHLLYLLSGLNQNEHLMHTVLYGPPGSGKTHIGLILSDIYRALGYSNGKFRIVKRSDLVAGYLGQTTLKTQMVINSVLGGVLFIDEAYSLGDNEQRDSFSKEMIDCLNQNLSENKARFICIIAGYREELEKCFFAMNPGLKRRFPFQYTITRYSPEDLAMIFKVKLTKEEWTLDDECAMDFLNNAFKSAFKYFNHQGGDVENLIQCCKITHSKRIFGRHQIKKRVITKEDFQAGLKAYLGHKRESVYDRGHKRESVYDRGHKRESEHKRAHETDKIMHDLLKHPKELSDKSESASDKSKSTDKSSARETPKQPANLADYYLNQMKKKKLV